MEPEQIKKDTEQIKKEIITILGNDISFEGHFDVVVSNMKDNLMNSLIEWIKHCKKEEEPISTNKKLKNIIVFFFKPSDSRFRGILTKEKNAYFITLFLDKHKYYDKERKRLGFV